MDSWKIGIYIIIGMLYNTFRWAVIGRKQHAEVSELADEQD